MSHSAAHKVLKKDPKMAKIIDHVGKFEIRTTRNYYESLVQAIITQQLAGPAAKAISNRFRSLYDRRFESSWNSGFIQVVF